MLGHNWIIYHVKSFKFTIKVTAETTGSFMVHMKILNTEVKMLPYWVARDISNFLEFSDTLKTELHFFSIVNFRKLFFLFFYPLKTIDAGKKTATPSFSPLLDQLKEPVFNMTF